MNCRLFKEKLEDFIRDDISEILKKEMESHMLSCSHCKRFYEDEIFINKAFEETLSIDEIAFKSQKDRILESIDKNRYNKTTYKSYKFYRSILKTGAPIAAAIAFILLINPLSKLQIIDNSANQSVQETEDKTINNNVYRDSKNRIAMGDDTDKSDKLSKKSTGEIIAEKSDGIISVNDSSKKNNNIKEEANVIEDIIGNEDDSMNTGKHPITEDDKGMENIEDIDNVGEVPENSGNEKIEQDNEEPIIEEIDDNVKEVLPSFGRLGISLSVPLNFPKTIVDSNTQYELLGSWNQSLDNKFDFYLPKRQSYNTERLYIKNLFNKDMWYLDLASPYREMKPKYIKWDNNDNLFIVFEEAINETICREELYIVNAETGDALMIYKVLDDSKSIIDVTRENNNIKLKIDINKYDNNDFYQEYTVYDAPSTL